MLNLRAYISLSKVRSALNRRGILWVAILWILTILMFAPNLGVLRSFFFEPKEKYLEERIGDIRLPIPERGRAYQTMHGMRGTGGAKLKYTIHGKYGGLAKVGLVRVGNRYSEPGRYVFRVYELNGKRKNKLVEISSEFPLNSFELFHTDKILEGMDDGETEILYELEPEGIKGKLTSAVAKIKGIDYHEDFAFITPRVVHKRKPGEFNVILLSFDTLRADRLGALGHSRPTTPNLDLFARKGVLFTQAVTSSPWTWPAHHSLFTGLYPSAHLDQIGDAYFCYANSSLPHVMAENGYFTVGITGAGVMGHAFEFNKGFHRFTEFESFINDVDPTKSWEHEDGTPKIFEDAINWLEANHDLRFFMFMHNYECHDPFEDTRFVLPEHKGSLIETRKALYDGDIRRLDDFFGRFIEKLSSLNLLSNTIIIVVSDHGEEMHDHFTEEERIRLRPEKPVPQIFALGHGHSVYDEILRIPVAFHIPGTQPKKTIIENQISIIDIMPTILDCLSIPFEGHIQGRSLLNLMKTGEREDNPPAISEYLNWGPEQKAVRMNGYKYVYTENPEKEAYFANIPRYAFFDLTKDPEEKNNIYYQKKELAREYHNILEQTLEESLLIKDSLKEQTQQSKMQSASSREEIANTLKALGYLQ